MGRRRQVHQAWRGILDDVAEMHGVDPRAVEITPDLAKEIRRFESAAKQALDECAEQFREDDFTVLDASSQSYEIFNTLAGSSEGIWDGRWDQFYPEFSGRKWDELIDCLKSRLQDFVDHEGEGTLFNALRVPIQEITEGMPDDGDLELQRALRTIDTHRQGLSQPPLDVAGWSRDDVLEFSRAVSNPDPRSPFASWKTLKSAQRATKNAFGPDSAWFYFYPSAGSWRRSIAYPPGGVVVDADPSVGRAVLKLDPERRRADLRRPGPSLTSFKASPKFLYHLTTPAAYLGIRRIGLQAGAFPGIGSSSPDGEGGYAEHSGGGIFLTDAAGVPYWVDNQMTKAGERVLLRTPKRRCPVDEPGTKDARSALGKKTTAYKCQDSLAPHELEVWDARGKAWRPLGSVVVTHLGETVLAPDPAHNPSESTFASLMGWTL